MEKLIDFIKQQGELGKYTIEDLKDGNIVFFSTFVTYEIFYIKNEICLRYALIECFDRWANSGFEIIGDEDKILNFLKCDEDVLVSAIGELIYPIVEDACRVPERRDIIIQDLINRLNKISKVANIVTNIGELKNE